MTNIILKASSIMFFGVLISALVFTSVDSTIGFWTIKGFTITIINFVFISAGVTVAAVKVFKGV